MLAGDMPVSNVNHAISRKVLCRLFLVVIFLSSVRKIISAKVVLFSCVHNHYMVVFHIPSVWESEDLLADNQHMAVIGERGGEDIIAAAVGELQTLAQFGYRQGEVTSGDIGLTQWQYLFFQLVFVH